LAKLSRESTPIDVELEEEIRELLATRLIAESPLSELMHPLLATVAGAMAWPHARHVDVLLWVSAVTIAAVGRSYLRRRAATSGRKTAAQLNAVRLGVIALGVAWGVGLLLVSVDLPPAPLAWITVIVAGLVSGATMTLLPDPPSFYFLASLTLGPLALAVLRDAAMQPRGLATFVIVTYGVAMVAFFRRAHRSLVKQFQVAKRLEITERMAGDERRMLDALVNNAPSAMAVVADDGRILRVNRSFEQMFGWRQEEVLNRPLNDLVLGPNERNAGEDLDRRIRAGEQLLMEVQRRNKSGDLIWTNVSAAPVNLDGSRVTFIIYGDLREAKRAQDAEKRFVQIIEATTDHVGILDATGKRRYMNSAGRDMLGIPRDENLAGTDGRDIIPERLREWALAKMQEVFTTGTWSGEMAFQHRDGHEVPVSIVALAQRNTAGQVDSIAAVAREISSEVALRDELRKARDAAEEATQAKSAFLANTSHEIRTPLNGILGMVELLLDTELNPAQRRSTELIASSGEALLATINDLLDLSKIEANQLELEEISFDLHHVVHACARLFMARASENDVELVSDVASDVPQYVKGDPHRLRQVLSNLVGNAVKFTHQGDVVLSARLEDAGEHFRMMFSVRDTGIGIAQHNIDRIFEPFRQVDASTTRQYGGTGLGLSIARKLVELMGGTLRVTSKVGEGSDFSFTLDLPAGKAPSGERPGALSLVGVRALVVDDHPINRRTISDMLRWAGCDVEDASNAEGALAALRKAAKQSAAFRLLISDVQMPGRDGFQLATDVKADKALVDTRVMLLTSVGRKGDGQKSRDSGVTAYMMKPVSRVELVEAAVTALRGTGEHALVTRHTIDEARRRMRILLAEDNPVNQEVAASMLRKRGHEVTIAGDGTIAVAFIRKGEPYDVILMDLQMPELDGLLATKEIRKLGVTTPIVALTANALAGERERCLDAGMSDYLSKPFKAHELFAVVEGWDTPAQRPMTAPDDDGAPPVDLASFTAMLAEAGIESARDQMLQVFLEYSAERAPLLRDAVAKQDYNEVERIAHALKSGSGTIKADTLAGYFKALEAAAQAADADQVQHLGRAIESESARVVAFIRDELK
jgi:two-component system sensor histidine kinase/response regulator